MRTPSVYQRPLSVQETEIKWRPNTFILVTGRPYSSRPFNFIGYHGPSLNDPQLTLNTFESLRSCLVSEKVITMTMRYRCYGDVESYSEHACRATSRFTISRAAVDAALSSPSQDRVQRRDFQVRDKNKESS